jgi:uncharacterized protein (DUF1800 family)
VWRRLGFGPAPGDVQAGVALGGPAAVVEDLLARPNTTVADWQWPANQGNGADITRWLSRMFELWAQSPGPVQERVAWSLSGMLVVALNDLVQYADVKDHHNRLRAWKTAGTYKALLQDVATTGPMQKYLSNIFSVPPHANENLARELMELFSLGVTHPLTGQPNYSETDVKEIARALTGYVMDYTTLAVSFNPQSWDTGTKTFLGSDRGAAKLPDVINAIASHDSFKYFVPRRLYKDLTGLTPSNATLGELASIWGSDGDLNGLVGHIARRPEFTADSTIGNRVKSPVELLTSIVRVLGFEKVDQFSFNWISFILRQNPIAAPDVAGWRDSWLHPTHLVTWSNVNNWLTWSDDGSDGVAPPVRNKTVRRLFAEANSTTAGDMALAFAGLYDVSPQTRQAVNAYASSGAWNYYRACATMQLVFDSPEFLVS